jgi:hypothetical protein
MVYHTSTDGDPIFVTAPDEKVGKQIFVNEQPGLHSHFPVWSPTRVCLFCSRFPPDDGHLAFVRPAGPLSELLIATHASLTKRFWIADTAYTLEGLKAGALALRIDVERRVPIASASGWSNTRPFGGP